MSDPIKIPNNRIDRRSARPDELLSDMRSRPKDLDEVKAIIEALKNGATDYIIKPVNEKNFCEKISKIT